LNAYFQDPDPTNNNNNNNNNTDSNSNDTDREINNMKATNLNLSFSMNFFESMSKSWLPVPLQRNQYIVAHYRATFPMEPYRETNNRTILYETTLHAIECAKSRTMEDAYVPIYVASDTALVVEAVRDAYPYNKSISNTSDNYNVWTYLDLQSYDDEENSNSNNSNNSNSNSKTAKTVTKQTITIAEDPPHLNFATQSNDITDFYVIFVDLFLMSYSKCVVYGAGGFGRMGSLVSYNPYCGIPYTRNGGILQKCNQYHEYEDR
jgi:hypothetical protein